MPPPHDPLAPFDYEPVHPDLLAWARQTLDVEEFEREMREIQETGGIPAEQVLAEVEAIIFGNRK